MGTEYAIMSFGDEPVVSGLGVAVMAYEMSGVFDVYVDVPKERVAPDAWLDCARVSLWEGVPPDKLLEWALSLIQTGCWNCNPSDVDPAAVSRMRGVVAESWVREFLTSLLDESANGDQHD